MLPAPTTIATSTPRAVTSRTWPAMRSTRSGSVPYSSVAHQRLAGELQQDALEARLGRGHYSVPPTSNRAKRAMRTFSPVFAATSVRSSSIVLPS